MSPSPILTPRQDLGFELAPTGHEVLDSDIVATHRWLAGVLGAEGR